MSKNFHLVISAAREFAQLQRPSFSQKLQFQDLLSAYLDNLPVEDITSICNILASCTHVPRSLIMKLCKQDANNCRSLLLTSPALQEADLAELIEGTKQLDHARVIARRTNLPPSVSALLRELEDEKVDRALDLRQRPLILAGQDAANSGEIGEDSVDGAFLDLCVEDSDILIYTAFADHLGLNLISCKMLCTDLTSRNLPTAMRYLNLSEDTAWRLYQRLAKSEARKPGVADAFSATYRNLTKEQCRTVISEWQMDELVMAVRYSSAANQSEPNKKSIKQTA